MNKPGVFLHPVPSTSLEGKHVGWNGKHTEVCSPPACRENPALLGLKVGNPTPGMFTGCFGISQAEPCCPCCLWTKTCPQFILKSNPLEATLAWETHPKLPSSPQGCLRCPADKTVNKEICKNG